MVLFEALFPMAARSKLWLCGRSLDGIADPNPDGDMEVSALVCCARVVS